VDWAQSYLTLAKAWTACEHGDHMLWLAAKLCGKHGSAAHRRVVLAACACARISLPIYAKRYPNDQRPLVAIERTERWARRERGTTLDDVKTAASSASFAASSASFAAYASAYAAYAASASAYASAYAADAAVRQVTSKQCADLVRQYIPCPRTLTPPKRRS
jgi:hypothetical protein